MMFYGPAWGSDLVNFLLPFALMLWGEVCVTERRKAGVIKGVTMVASAGQAKCKSCLVRLLLIFINMENEAHSLKGAFQPQYCKAK